MLTRLIAVVLTAAVVGITGSQLSAARPRPRATPQRSDELADTIRTALTAELEAIRTQRPAAEARDLTQLYDRTDGRPAWLSPDGRRADSSARDAIAMLADAAGDGLDPANYDVPEFVTVGDLPTGTPLPDGVYDEALAAGVRRFQLRHGLEVDGIIGRATQAAIAVPLTWRARQIELALERLRWLPDLAGGRVIVVNIPMFRLWAWNHLPTREAPALSMKVVVGRALDTQTPIFAGQLEYTVFRPYWNVPSSILRNEHVAELGRNGVRLRQRPGPNNALGLMKFIFPNTDDVYMHDSPARQLFARSRRDFSHGCIRVENPMGLAAWVLSDLPGWSRERIEAAVNGAPNQRVDLPEPTQVVIFYTTAVVQPEDGSVSFAEDIYGHDARLDKHL
jgi:murein L,D-transpeptidase YcbB/YkuD